MALFTSAHGGNVREAAQWLGVAPAELLDVSANINPLGMPPRLRQVLAEHLALAEPYPDVRYQALHARLAQHHQLPIDCLLAGNGETELIYLLVQHLRPRRALLVTPGFAEYRRALRQSGCEVVDHRLTEAEGWQLTDRLLADLTRDIDCLFLCTPNNPTGLMPDAALLEAIIARCASQQIALIVDEAFIDFLPAADGLIPRLSENPHLWILRSLTKFYAIAGLRLGYLAHGDPTAIAALRDLQMPWSINAFAALAGETVLDEVAYQQATWRWLAEEGTWLFNALRALPGLTVWPGRANYLFLRCDIPGLALQPAMLAQRVLIRSCGNYPGLDDRYYRVAVRSRAENQRLLAAFSAALSGTDPAE